MVKTIYISGKPYDLKASVYTAFKYAETTGRDFLKDISRISLTIEKLNDMPEEERGNAWLNELMSLLDTILHLAYVMILESNPHFMGFDDWAKQLDDLFSSTDWIVDVLLIGMSPFQGKLQGHNQKQ